MPAKEYKLETGTVVKIYKRKGSRNLRLTITSTGVARVTIPAWAPYRAGLEFAKSRDPWIRMNTPTQSILTHQQAVGKAHRLNLVRSVSASRVLTRLGNNTVTVTYPTNFDETSTEVQDAAKKASIRALRAQAEQLLPIRLRDLANAHGFSYKGVSIKQLKGRWGSCDNQSRIVLNLYLMQLPWDLIDYVLLHELTHTNILKHGPDFWAAMEEVLPHAKSYKKRLRTHQPVLDSPS